MGRTLDAGATWRMDRPLGEGRTGETSHNFRGGTAVFGQTPAGGPKTEFICADFLLVL